MAACQRAACFFTLLPKYRRANGNFSFIHLCLGYGLETPCGHIDFYPNGGFDQPGCSLFDMPVSLDSMVAPDSTAADTMGRHLVACSHNRGIELYIDSLRRLETIHNLRRRLFPLHTTYRSAVL